MNFKLLPNFLLYAKYSDIENLMRKFNIKNFEILHNLEYKKIEEFIFYNEINSLRKSKYYIFNINSGILKDNLNDIQKFVSLLKKRRINFIFLMTSRSITNLFDYIIIDKNVKKDIPYLKNLTSLNNKKGNLKNFIGPYNLDDIENKKYGIEILYNKNNNTRFYDLYFIEGINKYGIKYKHGNNYILLNNKNLNIIIQTILFYHPFISYLKYFMLSPNYIFKLKKIFKNNSNKKIDNKHLITIFWFLLKLNEPKIEKSKIEFNYKDFYNLIVKTINKFNIKLEILKLDTFPHVIFKKIK